MKSKNAIIVLLTIFTICCLLGCENNSKKAIDFGKYESGVYTNSYFKLKVTIPEAWYVMDDETRFEFMKKSGKIIAGKDKNLNAALEAADLDSLNLLFASEQPPGSSTNSNPNLILMAEKVKHLPGIVRGKDYHFHTKKMLEASAVKVSYPKEIYEEQIDGINFDVLEIQIDMGTNTIRQKQYATIMNGYALLFGLTYTDDNGLQKLDGIISAVNFNH
ncbi:MAG: hypothetical protein FP814_06850 [Desulfobacterium sp.]|nr:hypothetical protein [Desulfobacterium sp.]MBU3948389.1 hypothetical protein [Pseudomonadota bacterium]MBU4036861.1 hypothetical protein [Pseudomonadota bacterium]